MGIHDGVLVRVWREASRHIGIGESTAAIARVLAEYLPLRAVVLY